MAMSRRKNWFLVLLLLLVFDLSLTAQFTLPIPSGPYKTGTTHISFKSQNQSPLSTDPHEVGMHYAQVWYPTTMMQGDKAPFWPQAATSSGLLAAIFGLPTGNFGTLEAVKTNALLEVPITEGGTPLPVILFAHGYSFWVTQNTVLMEELASQGFVVFSLSFAYETAYQLDNNQLKAYSFEHEPLKKRWNEIFDATTTELYKKRTLEKDPEKAWQMERSFLSRQPGLQESAQQWLAEISLWIDQLEKLQAQHPLLKGRLNLDKIATMGHSFGGSAAVLASHHDLRVKAAINLDGAQYGLKQADRLDKPLLFMYSDSKAVDINSIYYQQSTADYYAVAVAQTGHLSFCDMPLFAPFLAGTDLVGAAPPSEVTKVINEAVLRFLKKYLQPETNQVLDLNLKGLSFQLKRGNG